MSYPGCPTTRPFSSAPPTLAPAPPLQAAAQSVDAPEFTGVVYVYYRVTARVDGPRNTVSYVQSLMLAPAS
ncbi:MAG: hypothetical protein M5R42_08965 [Rhodocyclaceae bacterium]|nr:hypothetical protein [Rhodocyclaceae bacterium]